jgi:hypothetical protein
MVRKVPLVRCIVTKVGRVSADITDSHYFKSSRKYKWENWANKYPWIYQKVVSGTSEAKASAVDWSHPPNGAIHCKSQWQIEKNILIYTIV